jgi:pimeloyl-ACP methyl ester carboxylesterase
MLTPYCRLDSFTTQRFSALVGAGWEHSMAELKPVKSGKVKVDDVNLYYEIYGQGDPLVLVAGTGISCAPWRVSQVPEFAKHYQVIIYDHRGLGRSDKPDVAYSTELFAKDCAGLMDALGIKRAHMLGHSMGARVLQWFALKYPEKVRSLVLSGPGSGKYDDALDYPRGVPLDAALEMIEKGYEKYQSDHWGPGFMFSEQFMKEKPDVVKKYQELIVDEVPPLKCYLRHVVARQCHETTHLIHKITAPTLVIVGSKDTHEGGTGNHVESARVLAAKIPGAELHLVEGGRHGYLREMPEKGHPPILDFLRRN